MLMINGYSLCLNEWALDKEIKNELGLLLIISSLCAEKGYCYANNNYFSEIFQIDDSTVSRKLKKLELRKYITIEYEKRGCEIISRKIFISRLYFYELQKSQSTIDENAKENIIIKENNNISNDILFKRKSEKNQFLPPKLEEVEQYCKERKNNVDAKKFYDYYSVNDWKDQNGRLVKNWKQKMIANWENKTQSTQQHDNQKEVPLVQVGNNTFYIR